MALVISPQKAHPIFGDKMANFGLIDFKLGLYIKVNVNEGKIKFEVHTSKKLAKIAKNWQKIGPDCRCHVWARH